MQPDAPQPAPDGHDDNPADATASLLRASPDLRATVVQDGGFARAANQGQRTACGQDARHCLLLGLAPRRGWRLATIDGNPADAVSSVLRASRPAGRCCPGRRLRPHPDRG